MDVKADLDKAKDLMQWRDERAQDCDALIRSWLEGFDIMLNPKGTRAAQMADARFKDLVYFTIDFDDQKDLVQRTVLSALISFKGAADLRNKVL
jgi:hypothetical protein